MASKQFCNTNEEVIFVFEAGSDSELSDLSDDDNHGTTIPNNPPRIAEKPDKESDENAAVEAEKQEIENNGTLQVHYDNNNEISDKMTRRKMQ